MYDSYNCKKQKSHPGSLCKWEAWWELSLQRYAYFLKLQNFLRINFCKIPCFERRLHIVSENLARLTINFFRRFSVTTSWFTVDSPVEPSDCYTSKDTDACAKRSVIVGCIQLQFGQFCCKNTFLSKNLFINSLFSFIFLYFCRAFAINAFVNNNFDMKIVELNIQMGLLETLMLRIYVTR